MELRANDGILWERIEGKGNYGTHVPTSDGGMAVLLMEDGLFKLDADGSGPTVATP